MAFPVVESITETLVNTDSASITVNLPATVNAGDMLLVILATDDQTFFSPWPPTGWTVIDSNGSTTTCRLTEVYKIADGTEGGGTVVFTFASGTQQGAAQVYRISGAKSVESAQENTGTSDANPDPPSLSPSWGSKDTLYIAAMCNSNAATVSSYPTSYTNGQNSITTGGATSDRASLGTARRQTTNSTENPGTFTLSSAVDWIAITLAIEPSLIELTDSLTATDTVTLISKIILLADSLTGSETIDMIAKNITIPDSLTGAELISMIAKNITVLDSGAFADSPILDKIIPLLDSFVSGETINVSDTIISESEPLIPGTWYTIRLEVEGNKLRGYLNDELKVMTEDPTSSLTEIGCAGIRFSRANTSTDLRVDNFRIYELVIRPFLDDPVLMQDTVTIKIDEGDTINFGVRIVDNLNAGGAQSLLFPKTISINEGALFGDVAGQVKFVNDSLVGVEVDNVNAEVPISDSLNAGESQIIGASIPVSDVANLGDSENTIHGVNEVINLGELLTHLASLQRGESASLADSVSITRTEAVGVGDDPDKIFPIERTTFIVV